MENVANESVIINSVTFLCNLNLINNYIYLILSFSNNRKRFKTGVGMSALVRIVLYVCQKKKKKKKKNKTLATRHHHYYDYYFYSFFLSLSLLYRRWRLQLLCVTHIPCFWKWWWWWKRNAHNGRKNVWVSAPSFVCERGFWQIMLVPIENEKKKNKTRRVFFFFFFSW